MNVFVLMKEFDQDEFKDRDGNEADPFASVVGVYADKKRAEYEMRKLQEESDNNCEELDCDPYTYYIEERPLLE